MRDAQPIGQEYNSLGWNVMCSVIHLLTKVQLFCGTAASGKKAFPVSVQRGLYQFFAWGQ